MKSPLAGTQRWKWAEAYGKGRVGSGRGRTRELDVQLARPQVSTARSEGREGAQKFADYCQGSRLHASKEGRLPLARRGLSKCLRPREP